MEHVIWLKNVLQIVCLMERKHPSLSENSLDFRHFSTSRTIADIPSSQSSVARWDTSKDAWTSLLEHKVWGRRKLGQIKSLGRISCLLLSASLQNQMKKCLTTLRLLDIANQGHIINIRKKRSQRSSSNSI